jgi:hypothetical protein
MTPPSEEALYEARDFDAFWRVYVQMHRSPTTRRVHFLATSVAMACVAQAARTRRLRWLILAPIADYAIAQTSHRVLEKNRTQPYRNPPWHLRAELRLWWLTLVDQMDDEIERLDATSGGPSPASGRRAGAG